MAELNQDLQEELAAIEHDRWSDWQSHCHNQGEKQPDGSIVLPAKVVERWERQIETPYEDLSESEKDSDREQVERYLPVLEESMKEASERVLQRFASRLQKAVRRRPTMEQQLEWLNSPKNPKKLLKPQHVFGCDLVEVGEEFVVYKNGVEVGRAKDRREAQEVARANWI